MILLLKTTNKRDSTSTKAGKTGKTGKKIIIDGQGGSYSHERTFAECIAGDDTDPKVEKKIYYRSIEQFFDPNAKVMALGLPSRSNSEIDYHDVSMPVVYLVVVRLPVELK